MKQPHPSRLVKSSFHFWPFLLPTALNCTKLTLVWLGIVVSGRMNHRPWRLASGFVGVYLLLNAVFLAMEGFINPANGQFRTVLCVLVGATVALSVWLTNTVANREG